MEAANNPDKPFKYLWDKPSNKNEYRFPKQSYVTYFKPLDWYIGSSVYEDEIFAHTRMLSIKLIIISLSVLIIVVILSILFANTLNAPIKKLINSIRTVEMHGVSSVRIVPSGTTEIRKLGEIFNNMLTSINKAEKVKDEYALLSKQNAKFTAIGQTTAILAHDVRKPFAMAKSLLSMLDVLKNSPSELNRAKSDIEKAIKHVETMISDIMDFSREVKLETKSQNIVNILDFSIRQTAQVHQNADISFQYNIQNTLKPLADDERLSRVFSNILANAIEAITIIGKKNAGTIIISTRNIEKSGNSFVEVVIGNDGPSFKEEDMPKLFESFFTKGKQKGTGLGLASVKKIINLHGGEVFARNLENNTGVESIIQIPASQEKEVSDKTILPQNIKEILFIEIKQDESFIDAEIKKLATKGQTIRVLLLEDEPLYRASVRNTIKNYSGLHQILVLYEARHIDDAFKLLETENITHAIIDIDLGETKNGFDFLKEAKEKHPALSCMVHSNRCIEEDKEKAKMLGAKAFVPKPLNIEHLVAFLSDDDSKQSPDGQRKKDFKKIILACDDDMLTRKCGEKILKNAAKDAEVYIFASGEDLLAKVKELESVNSDKYTYTVFTDQNMGGMSGLELTAEIRKLKIPCKIFMVANEPKIEFEEKVLNAGADGYFEAPLSEEILSKTLG